MSEQREAPSSLIRHRCECSICEARGNEIASLRAIIASSQDDHLKYVGEATADMDGLRAQLAAYEKSEWAPVKRLAESNEHLREQNEQLSAQLASARKALEEIAGESGSKYPSSIPISVAKRALAALTDEQGAA